MRGLVTPSSKDMDPISARSSAQSFHTAISSSHDDFVVVRVATPNRITDAYENPHRLLLLDGGANPLQTPRISNENYNQFSSSSQNLVLGSGYRSDWWRWAMAVVAAPFRRRRPRRRTSTRTPAERVVDLCNRIDQDQRLLDEQLAQLNQQFGRLYFSPDQRESEAARQALHSLMAALDDLMRQIRLDLLTAGHMLHRPPHHDAQQQFITSTHHPSSPGQQETMLNAVYGRLVQRFTAQIQHRQTVEDAWHRKLTDQYRRQLLIQHPELSGDQLNRLSHPVDTPSHLTTMNMPSHPASVQSHPVNIAATSNTTPDTMEIHQLAQSIHQLQSMFTEMQQITERDQTRIQRIQLETGQSAADIRLANRELEQSIELTKRQLWRRHVVIGLLVVAVLTLVGCVIWLGIVAAQ